MRKKTEEKEINEFKEYVTEKEEIKLFNPSQSNEYLNSGSSILNLALTDNIHNAFRIGTVSNIIGDESTGKTLLALTMIAEAIYSNKLKEYDFIYDDTESALSFDIEKFFGKKTREKLQIKSIEDKDNPCSVTVQDFSRNILKQLESKVPCIYVLDSFDALSSEEEQDRYGKKFQDGKELEGSFKTEKAKLSSEMFRVIVSKLAETKSFLLILSQTRENIGFGSMFKPKVRSGGKSLDFYSSSLIWLSQVAQIKEKELKIGTQIGFKITKNKNTGKHRAGKINLLNEIGVDDVGSIVDFLIDEDIFKKTGNKICIKGIDDEKSLFKKEIPNYIEQNNLKDNLIKLCQEVWDGIELSVIQNRQRRFV